MQILRRIGIWLHFVKGYAGRGRVDLRLEAIRTPGLGNISVARGYAPAPKVFYQICVQITLFATALTSVL